MSEPMAEPSFACSMYVFFAYWEYLHKIVYAMKKSVIIKLLLQTISFSEAMLLYKIN